jgi:hypothetical protein
MADRSVMHHAPHRPVPAHRVRPVPRPDGRAATEPDAPTPSPPVPRPRPASLDAAAAPATAAEGMDLRVPTSGDGPDRKGSA